MNDDWRSKHCAHLEHGLAIYGRGCLQRQLTLCESPAEQALLAGLLTWGMNPTLTPTRADDFTMQFPIDDYRVDFAFQRAHLVVEVDGFQWHDRTPELAEKDKTRDRILMAAGWRVVRFAAREVFRDPSKCALEVFDLLGAILLDTPTEASTSR